MLKLSNLSVGYQRHTIINDLNLHAAACELVALIGRNGAGKSTLLRTIARLQPPVSGEIQVAGKPAETYSRNEWAGTLSMVTTEATGVAHLTVKQLVSFGRFPHTNWIGRLSANDEKQVHAAMQQVDITALAHKNLHEISDGERQRAMIARTLAQDTALILLDEPTAFLDIPNRYEIVRLLHGLTRHAGKTIVFSTHDINIAMREADRFWLIIDGQIYEGAPEDLILNQHFSAIFRGTKVGFDSRNGEFMVERGETQLITLFGDGKAFFWTTKALERSGYAVRREENRQLADIIAPDGNESRWTCRLYGKTLLFPSIYELLKHLQKQGNAS